MTLAVTTQETSAPNLQKRVVADPVRRAGARRFKSFPGGLHEVAVDALKSFKPRA